LPTSNNSIDLGTNSLQFKNTYTYGTAQIAKARISYMSGTTLVDYFDMLAASGQFTIQNSSSTVLAQYSAASTYWAWAGKMIPGTAATYDLGDSTYTWRDLFISRNATFGGTLTLTAGNMSVGSSYTYAVSGGYFGQDYTLNTSVACTIYVKSGIIYSKSGC
jgi:hypothetical protein